MYRTVVTICTAQWSLYVLHSGHYMYRTVVTMCTAQWSLCVPHSGHYKYRPAVTICTALWSLYVPHSGHYMYRTVVTICTAQWSLYIPHSGHYMYRTVVTICTASLTSNNSTFCPHSVFMCFVWISEQTDIFPLSLSFCLRGTVHFQIQWSFRNRATVDIKVLSLNFKVWSLLWPL
jgi:hypothetical protein